MEPIAIVTVILGAMYIVGRGPLLVAPQATVTVYRSMFSTHGRTRVFGSVLALLAIALVVTARQARIEHGGVTIPVEVMGWLSGGGAAAVLFAPDTMARLVMGFWDSVSSDSGRRLFGAVNIAFGICEVSFGDIAFITQGGSDAEGEGSFLGVGKFGVDFCGDPGSDDDGESLVADFVELVGPLLF